MNGKTLYHPIPSLFLCMKPVKACQREGQINIAVQIVNKSEFGIGLTRLKRFLPSYRSTMVISVSLASKSLNA